MNSIIILKKLINVPVFLTLLFILNFAALSQTNSGDFSHNISITQELKVPVRAAIDKAGNIYVTDASQKCIVQFDTSWNYVGKIYVGENPTSIAFSDNNTMFIGDYNNGKIYKRLSDGTISVIYTDTIYPSSMVVSPINELYVVDSRSKKVLVLDFSGNLIRTIGGGIFLYPTGIAFDRKNNRIIVAEHGGFGNGFNLHAEIRIFGTSGNLISTFGGWGNSAGKFYRIQGLTVGRCGNIYVTDPYQGNISVFNGNGTYITKFGIWGDTLGKLNVPMDVIFDSHEKVCVVSLNNSAIEVYNIADSLPSSTIISSNASICAGNTTPVIFSFTGTAPWTFTYAINGSNPQTITNTFSNPYILNTGIAGMYNVTALSDANHNSNCFSSSANVFINPMPTSNITNIHSNLCAGTTANIPVSFTGVPPWSFTYTIDSVNQTTVNDIYSNPYNLNVNHAGKYKLVALTGGSCPGTLNTGTAIITENPLPESTITNNTLNICNGTTAEIQINLTGTSPWNLTYTVNDQNSQNFSNISSSPFIMTVAEEGIYKVIGLTDSNCVATTFNGNAVITKKQKPVSTISSVISTFCENDSAAINIDLLGASPWSFTYTVDGINPVFLSNINTNHYTFYTQQPGNFEVISLEDANCNGIDFYGNASLSILSLPTAVFNYNINNLEVVFANNSSDADSYFWDFGDGNTTNSINPVHLYDAPGIYTVSLTAISLTCGTSVFFDTLNLNNTSIKDINYVISFNIFPNPSHGEFTLEINNPASDDLKLEIFNSIGQSVYTKKTRGRRIDEKINLSNLSSGVYSVKLISHEITKINRLVLAK
ncbi:MAG: T9SS type A sorting domain-containing protein [Bacteroidales bacterium]